MVSVYIFYQIAIRLSAIEAEGVEAQFVSEPEIEASALPAPGLEEEEPFVAVES